MPTGKADSERRPHEALHQPLDVFTRRHRPGTQPRTLLTISTPMQTTSHAHANQAIDQISLDVALIAETPREDGKFQRD